MVMDVEFYFWFQEHLLKLQLMVFKHGLKMMVYIDCSFKRCSWNQKSNSTGAQDIDWIHRNHQAHDHRPVVDDVVYALIQDLQKVRKRP